jgi:hypothetical protein
VDSIGAASAFAAQAETAEFAGKLEIWNEGGGKPKSKRRRK